MPIVDIEQLVLCVNYGIVSNTQKKVLGNNKFIHSYSITEILLQIRFNAFSPGQCLESDIIYISTLEDWLYLLVTLDLLFHQRVIGSSMGRWITRELKIDALNMAINNG
jgi:hypothetical protein